MKMMRETKIAVIGLGYVGLPLARLFSTRYRTVGYDRDRRRVDSLNSGHDDTLEVDDSLLQLSKELEKAGLIEPSFDI